jgi:hypothetical protein
VIDLGGLTDEVIARSPGGHVDKRVDAAYLRARSPDAIVLHTARPARVSDAGELLSLDGYPVERRTAAMPFVRENFRVAGTIAYAPSYHYVVLARSGLPLRLTAVGERDEGDAEKVE